MVGMRLYQALIAGLAMAVSGLPIRLLSSTSREGLLRIVESRYVKSPTIRPMEISAYVLNHDVSLI